MAANNEKKTGTALTDIAEKKSSRNENQESDKEKTVQEESLLEKFFRDQLADIYYAEKQIIEGLTTMEDACTTEELKEAFNDHLHVTHKQIKRLQKVFRSLGREPQTKKCEAIDGLIRETETIIKETKDGTMTRDAALIIAAQKIEHYEIATYGGLVQLAVTIGLDEAADLLERSLIEEEDTDLMLTEIAENFINIEAEEEDKFSTKKK